jgi:hypothetical protein
MLPMVYSVTYNTWFTYPIRFTRKVILKTYYGPRTYKDVKYRHLVFDFGFCWFGVYLNAYKARKGILTLCRLH